MTLDFSDIRYYTDEEFREIRMKFAAEPGIVEMMQYFFPKKTREEVFEFFESLETLREFQLTFVVPIINEIVKRTTTAFTASGIENLDTSKKYLFISNHRNIVLDSALMNYYLFGVFKDKFTTTANAIGHNLLVKPIVSYLLRSNKSFIVKRALKAHEMLLSSQQLSAYMRKLIVEDESSVWIAQREGRTKNGDDRTQTGLIKMLSMSGDKDFVQNFSELQIVPVSISYEFDPCDVHKVYERLIVEGGQEYVKGPMEDYESMKRGTMGWKGRIHIHFGKEIMREDYQRIDPEIPLNKKVKEFTEYIDKQIHLNYKLFPINYFAADQLHQGDTYADFYTLEEKELYLQQMKEKLATTEGDDAQKRRIYLEMYANPVLNYYAAKDNLQ